jgi:hypothetical protein
MHLNTKIKNAFVPYRVFLHYNEHVIEQTTDSDSVDLIFDGIYSTQKNGCAPNLCIQMLLRNSKKSRRPISCYTTVSNNKALTVHNVVHDITGIKNV